MMKHLVLRSWWLVLGIASGCFSPQFQDGQILCGPNQECPPGLECFGTVCRAEDPGPDASTTFPLTITLGGNSMGTVTSNPTGIDCGTDCTEQFLAGTMVTLTAAANSGSTFMGWSGACSGTGTCTITVSTAINVTASFAADNSLLVVLAGTGSGLVSSNPAGINCGTNCSYQFPVGTMVTLTALPATGSTFDGWSGGGCTGTGTCMVTTDAAKMVTATFSLTQHSLTVTPAGTGFGTVTSSPSGINCGTDCNESYTYNTIVTLSAMPATGSTFTGWSGACTGTGTCTVTMTAATNVTATFTVTQHSLTVMKSGNGTGTVTSAPSGINCGTTCTQAFDYNTMVTLSAVPAAGSTFTGWTGGGCTGTASCTIAMTAAASVTATFTLNAYTLAVQKAGNGSGLVTSNVAGITCGADCDQAYNYNTMVTLTAAPTTGSVFGGWSEPTCTGTSCTVTITAAQTVTATFTLTTHTLSVVRIGTGSGSVTGVGITCGGATPDCTETVDYNTVITLSATPAAGSTFDGWSGGGCSGTGTCQVTMTQMTGVTATFTLTTHLLTVQKAGTGAGTVSSAPAGISCGTDCNEQYNYNTSVTLTASPSAGSTFGGWAGGGCTGLSTTCVTTVTAAATVTATFTLTNQTLTVTKAGAGTGTVTSNIGTINCGATCSSSYPYGSMVTLTALPDANNSFTGWSGGGCTGNGTCTVTLTAATGVTATFSQTTAALSVTKSGTGSGTVTSNVGGINCGATCSGTITFGTSVTLTATPTTGSVFTSWSGGACNGSTMTTCTFTLNSATTVNANFQITSFQLNVNKSGSGTGLVTSNDTPQGITCGADCNQTYNYGTSVTLTATAAANATFTGWTGGGCMGTGTCTVSITAATSVSAGFSLIQHTLTVKQSGPGSGVVTSTPAGINCGADCDELYNDSQTVMLTPAADPGSSFAGWDPGSDCDMVMGNTCIVTMNASKVVYANFDVATYLVSVSNVPGVAGDIQSTDGMIDCGSTCSATYQYGDSVSLKPSARSGYTFSGWTGAGCSGTGTCDFTVDGAKNVVANYVVTTYTLTVNRAGTGSGSVVSMPAGINCGANCSATYTAGQMLQLSATPATGSTFTSWSGCTSVSGTTCNVTMTASKSVTANFTIITFSVNLTKAGTGTGTVTSSPAGINCGAACISAAAPFNYNTMVTLSATPTAGSTFSGWSGACTGTGSCGPLTMTAAQNVTATFAAIPPNYVFVTSSVYTGNLGGLAGADAKCQSEATTAGITGTYKAWLSTTSISAISRLGSARGWVRREVSGTIVSTKPVVDQKSDIQSGHFFYPPRYTAAGTDAGNVQIWSGTVPNGGYSGDGDCSAWTSSAVGLQSTIGAANASSELFTSFGTGACPSAYHLLCFGVDNTAVVAPPVVNARRAFTPLASWTPGGGIASADAFCAAEATTAGLSGTYKALLPTTTASAISRFTTTGAVLPWARFDHALLAPTAAALATPGLAFLDSAPNNTAANNIWLGNVATWGGTSDLTSVGTVAETCNNWTDGTSAGTARGGRAGYTYLPLWFRQDTWQCNANFVHLICLQQ